VGCYVFYGGGHGNAYGILVCNSVSVICVTCLYPVTRTDVNLVDLLMGGCGRILCHTCHLRIICCVICSSETFCRGGELQEPAL